MLARTTVGDVSSSFLPSQLDNQVYTSTHGIQLALESKLHERQLLNLRGTVAIECMDQMLLVSTPSGCTTHSGPDSEVDTRCWIVVTTMIKREGLTRVLIFAA